MVFCGLWDHILDYVGTFWATLAPYLANVGAIFLERVGTILGLSWAILGMLGHFGPRWHHIGLMLGHFALFSDLCRPLFWTWAFQCR